MKAAPSTTGKLAFTWVDPAVDLGKYTIDASQFSSWKPEKGFSANHKLFCAVRKGEVVAMAQIYHHPGDDCMALQYLETAKNASGHGVGKLLLSKLFSETQAQHQSISSDGFTELGKAHLLEICLSQPNFYSAGRC